MSYATYSDEELRRVLVADPKDAAAIVEAADRYCRVSKTELDVAYDDGYDAGHEDACLPQDCPHCGEDITDC